MDPITSVVRFVSRRAREKRSSIFCSIFHLDEDTKILDLGSENGANINAVLKDTNISETNVYIADINEDVVAEGNKLFGYHPVLINESEPLPFPDDFFDIVYCSSVIEHVTVLKEKVWTVSSGIQFKNESLKRQEMFASEIKRLGKQYFVQTPYKYFPVESHSWLPFIGWLPRWLQVPLLHFTNLFWVKKTSPDWYLLNKTELSELFQEANIIDEKFFGITKSIMAVFSQGTEK